MFCLSNFIISPQIIFPIKLKDNLPSPCYPWAFMKGQGLETGLLGRASWWLGLQAFRQVPGMGWPNPCLRYSWERKNPVAATTEKGTSLAYPSQLLVKWYVRCHLSDSPIEHHGGLLYPFHRWEPELRHFGTVVCIQCFKDCHACPASADSNLRSVTWALQIFFSVVVGPGLWASWKFWRFLPFLQYQVLDSGPHVRFATGLHP